MPTKLVGGEPGATAITGPCTPQTRVFLHGSWAKPMLTRGLGDAFAGVLVSDFYGVYTGYEGVHQYCWAHLLRDIHELVDQHPDDPTVWG